jgi:glycosyltransferase involved in cell wall biosynthesis
MKERLATGAGGFRVHAHNFIGCGSWIRRRIWHGLIYPRWDRAINADADFYLSGYLPVFPVKAPNIVTCHSLLPFDTTEIKRYSSWRDRRSLQRIRRRQIKSYNAAAARIYLSEYSRRAIQAQLKACSSEVVISHGTDRTFLREGSRSYAFRQRVKLLYVSDIHPYKNHETVLNAVAQVRRASGSDIHLYLAGAGNAMEVPRLHNAINMAHASSYVHALGSQSDSALRELYNDADVFVFASSLETFGITLLEAMSSRLPIACSNRSGLPELLGDAGIYFDPFDVTSLVTCLTSLLGSEGLRMALGGRAHERAKTFSWDRCRSETFAFIEHVIGVHHQSAMKA